MPSLNTGNAILSNAIAVNSSYNVGIGGAASGSYKFQVTGTSLFTDGTQGLNIRAYTGGAGFGAIYSSGVTAGAGNFALAASSTQTILSGVDNVNLAINSAIKLAIASTGAATFSSSVAANGVMSLGNDGTYGSTYKTLGLTGNTDGTHRIFAGTADNLYIAAATGRGVEIWTNGVTSSRMFISSGGNVGIGTSSPNLTAAGRTVLDINGASNSTLVFSSGGTYKSYIYNDGTNLTTQANTITYETNFTERMRITSDGKIDLAGGSLNGRLGVTFSGAGLVGLDMKDVDDTVNAIFQYYRNSSNTGIGSITRSGGTNAVLFNTTSDYRLKEDFKEVNGLDKVSKIKVYDFKWKGFENRMDGVIAHELQEILPYAVNGEKDALDENGNEFYQGVDYSKLVPVLIKSIQELNQKVENQQQTINSLINR